MDKVNEYSSLKIAETIKLVAKEKGIVIGTMLLELSLGSNTISNMRHGRMIAADSLAKIADYMDCSVDFLLGRTKIKIDTTTIKLLSKIFSDEKSQELEKVLEAILGAEK